MNKSFLITIFLLITATAQASDYYATCYLQGKNIGNFIISEQEDGQLIIDQAFFERLRLPVTEAKPLSFLEKYGKYEWNRVNQSLYFYPTRPEYFAEQKAAAVNNPVKSVENKSYDLKSIDYQAISTFSSAGKPQYGFLGTATGKIFGIDLDAAFSSADSQVKGLLQWHKEENIYVKDVQLGTIPLYGINRGLSVSNEPATRYQNGFASQPIFTNYPLGSRIDLYRAGMFINNYSVNAVPFRIDLELAYGSNNYTLRVYQPDGVIKEEYVTKSVDSFLVKKGQVEYALAGGVDDRNKIIYKARISYGLTSWATLFVDADRDRQATGAYLRVNEDLLITPKLFTDGFGSELYYRHDWLNFSGNYVDRTNIMERRGIIGIKTFLQPIISISETEQKQTGNRVLLANVGLSTNYKQLYMSPFAEYRKDNGNITKAIGTNGMYLLPQSYRLNGNYRYQDDNSQKLNLSIIKSLNVGEITLSSEFYQAPHQSFKINNVGAEFRFYNWQYASLSAAYNHSFTSNNDTAIFSVSGSLTRGGALKTAQRGAGTIQVKAFLTDTGEAMNTTIYMNNQSYLVENGSVIIPDLVPYIPYTITAEAEIDAEPLNMEFSITPTRGELATVNIPFSSMDDIEGQIASKQDGIKVHLLDTNGKIVKTQKTRFDGCYSFRVRVCDKYTVSVEQPIEPVIQPEPAFQSVPWNPVEPVIQPEPVIKAEPKIDTVEIVYPKQDKINPVMSQIVAQIRVNGKPNIQDIKAAARKIKEQGNVMVLIWAYDKTEAKALKLAKKIERLIEREGVYVHSIEGFASDTGIVEARIKPFNNK